MDNNFNINIDKDDFNTNDYLYCWNEFKSRPNKLNFYSRYDVEEFFKIFSEYEQVQCGSITDVIMTEDGYMVNEKSFIRINDSIFISFLNINKGNSENVIGDVSIYYSNQVDENKLNEISKDLSNIQIEEQIHQFNNVCLGQNGLELTPIDILDFEDGNVDMYYENSVMRKSNKLIKKLKKKNKGLTLVWGNRGCGKTTLVSYITSNVDKKVIYVPLSLAESINTAEFLAFLRNNRRSILIIDDIEILFQEIYQKSGFFVNNVLQLVDGYQSDDLSLQIILISNTKTIETNPLRIFGEDIFDCNNILSVIEVPFLGVDKSSKLIHHLKFDIKVESEMKLSDILNKNKRKINMSSVNMGYH